MKTTLTIEQSAELIKRGVKSDKARVKATGEIVTLYGTIDSCVWVTTNFRQYWESELEFISEI